VTSASVGSTISHVIGADGLFSIRLEDGEIRLRAVAGDTVCVRDVDDGDLDAMFSTALGEGSASLTLARGGLSRTGSAPQLAIEIPSRATVVVEARTAEIEADGLIGDQRYRTVSGDTRLRSVSGRIAVDAVSGDIDVDASGEAAMTVRTVSGDVEIRAATITSLEAATTSGDIHVAARLAGPGPFAIVTVSGDALLAPAGDVRIEMATLSGDLHSELAGRPGGGRGRRSLEVGTGGPLVTVRSMSGDLSVVPPELADARDDQQGSDSRRAPVAVGAPMAPAAPVRPVLAPVSPPLPAPPPTAAAARAPTANSAIAAAYEDARLRILRSLEAAEIDVAEAARRLETLDGDGEPDPDPVAARAAGDDGDDRTIDPGTETTRFARPGPSDA
jgi:hypothetical protein